MQIRIASAAIALLIALTVARAEPARLEVEKSRSTIAVKTFKEGFLSFFAGHEHGILVPSWSVDICADPQNWEKSDVTVNIPTASLVIDTPEARRAVDLDPDGGPSGDDKRKVQRQMLAPENLAADRHPEIQFESRAVRRKGPAEVELVGALQIRGRREEVQVPVRVTRPDGGLIRVQGSFKLNQTSFGIEPADVAGVVKVKDQVEIRMDIYGRMTEETCGTREASRNR